MRGVILLPSLNRAELVNRFFGSYRKTESVTPVWVLVDENDPQRKQYEELELPEESKLILTGDAVSMGDKVRKVWDEFKDLDFTMVCNDDHLLVTPKWDEKVKSQINGTNVVFTNDGISPDKPWNFPNRICGAICFSGKVLRTLGYMFPPGLHHFYSDDAWGYLFTKAQAMIGIGDVCVYHDHAYLDASKQDETFRKVNGPQGLVKTPEGNKGVGGFWIEDEKTIKTWFESGIAEKDMQKIVELQPKQGVMIATPSHDGNVAINYALGLTDCALHLTQHRVYFEMARVIGSSLIPHARNSLVDMFLKSKCQRLLMVDADQGFDKNALFALLGSPRKIIAGITPHKRFPINLNFEPLPEDQHFFKSMANKGFEEFKVFATAKADPLGSIEVNRAGTGFIMIDRSVFEIMAPHVDSYLAFDDRADLTHKEFFKMGGNGDGGRFRGEDWLFCELAKKLKIPIHISANAVVTHQGTYTFQAG